MSIPSGLARVNEREGILPMSTTQPTSAFLDELAAASARFETAAPGEIIAWAIETFAPSLTYACSFQDIVLLDLAVTQYPKLEVVFLDTDAHFQETLDYVEDVRQRYDLNLVVTHPDPADNAPACGESGCCQGRKVAPLQRAVSGKDAWLTSVKRVDAQTRGEAPIVSWDDKFGLVKINPLATWTDADVAHYEASHGLPVHPLISQGYLSIGCAPTTRPVAPGEDPRAGRWADSDKVECGLHG